MAERWENLSDPVFHYAQRRADAPALIEEGATFSYRALAVLVAKAAVYLRDLGIREGERVGVALTNSADHVILTFALLRIGAVLVELSLEDNADALAAVARKYGIGTIFTEAHVAAPAGVRRIRVDLGWRGQLAAKSGDQRSAAGGDALQLIALTTGSTGVPSGWILTQRDVMARVALFRASRYPPRADGGVTPANLLLALPLRYIWSINSVLVQFAVGGPVILLPEFAKAPDILRAVASWDDAIVSVTPNTCRHFVHAAPSTGLLLPRLRRLEAAGQLLYGEEKRAVLARVTPNFHEGYGTTAGGFITTLDAVAMMARPDSVGRAVPGMEIEVAGPFGERLPVGVAGSIRCRPLFTRGQCREDAGRGSERIEGGWCYTGDIGLLDSEGYLYLKGRGTDVIRRGGVEVFAPEIEAALLSHPAVADAAVVGRPKQDRGEEIVAFIVKRGELTHDEITRHCRTRLAADRLPDRIFYTDALPRIPGGKVNRVRLVEAASQEAAREAAGAPRRSS